MKQDNSELCKVLELIARANYINSNWGHQIRYAIHVLETGVDISFDLEYKNSVTLFYDRNTPNAYKNSEIYKIESYMESLEWSIKEKQRKDALIESAKSKLTRTGSGSTCWALTSRTS